MAKYEALRSFVGVNISASKGRIVELDEKAAKELLRVGYVKAVAAEEPAPEAAERAVTIPEEGENKDYDKIISVLS